MRVRPAAAVTAISMISILAAGLSAGAGGAGLNATGADVRACGERPPCLPVQYYPPQQYGQQPYQPYPPPSYQQSAPPSYQPYPQPSYPSQSGSQRFDYPTERGTIVDACAYWATDCGQGGANQFCRSRGFSHALTWSTNHPGRTYVIGSGQTCTGRNCTGLVSVTCG